MLHIKEYFTEGLIQMAILLSLCGVRVDVGLEAFMPPSWCELILGPTSALTHTQILNLRNRYSLHPKTVDLDQFFTARRLLGWVRSLDRIQVKKHTLIRTSFSSATHTMSLYIQKLTKNVKVCTQICVLYHHFLLNRNI